MFCYVKLEWSKWVPRPPAPFCTKTTPSVPACTRSSHLAHWFLLAPGSLHIMPIFSTQVAHYKRQPGEYHPIKVYHPNLPHELCTLLTNPPPPNLKSQKLFIVRYSSTKSQLLIINRCNSAKSQLLTKYQFLTKSSELQNFMLIFGI